VTDASPDSSGSSIKPQGGNIPIANNIPSYTIEATIIGVILSIFLIYYFKLTKLLS
jgi:hypothetical protein